MSAAPSRLGPVAWLRRHRLFVLIGLTYAYFYEGGDPNQGTRIFLARALVERHAPDITPDHYLTIDKGEFRGRYYSEKGPGISFLATVPYALLNAADRVFGLDAHSRPVERARLHMIVIAVSGVAGVIAAYCVHLVLLSLGAAAWEADFLTFAYALGTLAFPYSCVLFGHQVAAAALIGSFALLRLWGVPARPARAREWAILGALCGLAVITEYPVGLIALALGLYTLGRDFRPLSLARAGLLVLAGAALPLAVHSLYLLWSFGSPFDLPYNHVTEPIFRSHTSAGILGMGWPKLGRFWGVTVSRYRGIFYLCPVLTLTWAGFAVWLRKGGHGREGWLCASVVVGYLLFCCGYYAWDGGASTGPRHLTPALPFFIPPILFFLRLGRWARWSTVAAIAASVLVMFLSTAVLIQQPEGDVWASNPLYATVVSSLSRGEIALNVQDIYHFGPRRDASYNLGTLVGLGPMASLLLPVAAWAAAYAGGVRRRKRDL